MKDFNSYNKENGGKDKNAGSGDRALSEDESAAIELTRKALSVYNGKSDAAVLNDILKQAETARREGKLTDEEIDNFYAQFSPMLGLFQREKLRSVLQQLKKI